MAAKSTMSRWFASVRIVKDHDERVGALPDCAVERRPQILRRSHVDELGLEAQGSSRRSTAFH